MVESRPGREEEEGLEHFSVSNDASDNDRENRLAQAAFLLDAYHHDAQSKELNVRRFGLRA